MQHSHRIHAGSVPLMVEIPIIIIIIIVSSLNNMAFNLCLHNLYYWFCHCTGHLNGNNNDCLALSYVYVYAVPFLVRTINVLKIFF